MRIEYYLIALAVLLAIIVMIIILFPVSPEENDEVGDDVILTLSDFAGSDYIEKIYFVGDSTTYHFYKGGIKLSHILVPDSCTLKLSSDILDVKVGKKSLSIPNAIAENKAEIAVLTVGVNGADSFSEKQYKTYYKKLICAIKDASPKTKLIIQSVFPVAEWYSKEKNGISNEGIDRVNGWSYELAKELGINYLDTQSVLKNENGAQILLYGENDGVHLNALGYEKILEYIATHAID